MVLCAVACSVFVTTVVDGDSLFARFPDGEVYEARLEGVDALDFPWSGAQAAYERLQGWVEGRTVEARVLGVGFYGRLLVQLYADGRNINRAVARYSYSHRNAHNSSESKSESESSIPMLLLSIGAGVGLLAFAMKLASLLKEG